VAVFLLQDNDDGQPPRELVDGKRRKGDENFIRNERLDVCAYSCLKLGKLYAD
jgi:hypothetical protein